MNLQRIDIFKYEIELLEYLFFLQRTIDIFDIDLNLGIKLRLPGREISRIILLLVVHHFPENGNCRIFTGPVITPFDNGKAYRGAVFACQVISGDARPAPIRPLLR